METQYSTWLEQMGAIFETINEGVLIADDRHHTLFVNSVFEEMTGFPRQELTGRDAIHEYYSPEDYAIIRERRDQTLVTGRSRSEFFLPTKGGGRLPVLISARALTCPTGGQFTVVTFTDISELKNAETHLRVANSTLEKRQKEIEADLILAARVQQSLAPKSTVWGAIQVESFYLPARTIGGDFGLVSSPDEKHLNLMVCDVSGHGIGSALVANRIYSETMTQLQNGAPLGEMLRQLNSFVMRSIESSVILFTLAAARLDRSGRRMSFAGAGHPPAMIVQPGEEPRLLGSHSTVLGAFPDAVAENASVEVDLRAGDRIVLYTDGITDVFDSRGEILGVEGVRKFVREAALLPFSKMKQAILDKVAAWREGPPSDDMSLVLVEV